MKHYLLTGATGVVGSAVLQRLLTSDARVILPVRAGSYGALAKRVADLINFIRTDTGIENRLFPIRADILKPDLGMDRQEYRAILRQTTHIIHCAGDVRMNLPQKKACDQAMAMTRNMITLMENSRRIRKMEYVSTVGVAGHTPGQIPETWINSPRSFRNSYEAAKASAEGLIRERIRGGLNITVHRPSMVVGHSQTGRILHFQVFYYLCEFLSGVLTHGWVPDLAGHSLDLVPLDYVADLICWASTREKDLPHVLHACSGKNGSIPLDTLGPLVLKTFRSHGRKLPRCRKVSARTFTMLAKTLKACASKSVGRQLATLPMFLSYLSTPQYFSNSHTLELADRAGISLPDYNSYLPRILKFYIDRDK